MVKIWRNVFLGTIDEDRNGTIRTGLFIGPCILVVTSILLGLFGGTVMQYAHKASTQLMNPDQYIRTVMDDSPVDGVAPGEYTPKKATNAPQGQR